MSGKSERRLLLAAAGVVLLVLAAIILVTAIIVLASYLFGHLTFASGLFSGAPWTSVAAALATGAAGAFAIYLAVGGRDPSRGFRTLAVVLIIGFLLCLATAATCMLLREVIGHTFASSTVLAQLRRRPVNAESESRWSALESAYECCGGGRSGYKDYADDNGAIAQGEPHQHFTLDSPKETQRESDPFLKRERSVDFSGECFFNLRVELVQSHSKHCSHFSAELCKTFSSS
jgi:hypothetical protein